MFSWWGVVDVERFPSLCVCLLCTGHPPHYHTTHGTNSDWKLVQMESNLTVMSSTARLMSSTYVTSGFHTSSLFAIDLFTIPSISINCTVVFGNELSSARTSVSTFSRVATGIVNNWRAAFISKGQRLNFQKLPETTPYCWQRIHSLDKCRLQYKMRIINKSL